MIDKEYRDVKAVKVAITHIHAGDFTIRHPEQTADAETVEE